MERVLVTGGAGFVGRHLCKHLLDNKYEIDCVDNIVPLTGGINPNDGWPLYNPLDYENFNFFNIDCRNFFHENKNREYTYAFHLAAMVGGRMMIEYNPIVVAEDLSIDAAFWNWAKVAKPKKVICFSSSAAYPIKYQYKDGYRLLTEDMISFIDDIGMPDLSYGWAKLTHEYLAKLAFRAHGINSVIYRPFSGYGEDQDKAYPFPSICMRALTAKNPDEFEVWGSGDQMRDFIHIDDCVKGIIATMDMVDDAGALNLSTGRLTSFKEFARVACKLCGFAPTVHGTSTKPEGVFARGGDTEKQKKYGFTAQTSFETGIKNCLDYFERNMRSENLK
ncbi:hypothetical protein HMPREF1022_02063 [Desulfovibrio sp. 6_1_46AFAA]|uniref:NAD-dependent epimerase/dehydratase family protein n=1 Tax=Desulfovibrio sp. 6_1_46AFAA TaxID=665942 RepID=UPI00022372F5|nr:NAD-dependent epimerase/dehydratase family protein [Desulfovibrio sp. 6_1_46AFAA]EGW50945.1 hypothetical protein HMPREF1022_02063 [Desulfovibrio sp. 6_1_46AFAA]